MILALLATFLLFVALLARRVQENLTQEEQAIIADRNAALEHASRQLQYEGKYYRVVQGFKRVQGGSKPIYHVRTKLAAPVHP